MFKTVIKNIIAIIIFFISLYLILQLTNKLAVEFQVTFDMKYSIYASMSFLLYVVIVSILVALLGIRSLKNDFCTIIINFIMMGFSSIYLSLEVLIYSLSPQVGEAIYPKWLQYSPNYTTLLGGFVFGIEAAILIIFIQNRWATKN